MAATYHGAMGGVRGERASEAGNALDEQKFTPPNIEVRREQSMAPELH